jgi:hypothetical protein
MFENRFAAQAEQELRGKWRIGIKRSGALKNLEERPIEGRCELVNGVRKIDGRSVTLVNLKDVGATVVTPWD